MKHKKFIEYTNFILMEIANQKNKIKTNRGVNAFELWGAGHRGLGHLAVPGTT